MFTLTYFCYVTHTCTLNMHMGSGRLLDGVCPQASLVEPPQA